MGIKGDRVKTFLHLKFDNRRPQGEFIMIETAKYCQTCIDTLFPAIAKTDKEKQFFAAFALAPRPASDFGHHRGGHL